MDKPECRWCGRLFEPNETGSVKRYCSHACRIAHYRFRRAQDRLSYELIDGRAITVAVAANGDFIRKHPLKFAFQTNTIEFPPIGCICPRCPGGLNFDVRFVAIDHVFGDGKRERLEYGEQMGDLDWTERGFLRKHWNAPGFPNRRYQSLCHACNLMKATKPWCPHESDRLTREQRDEYKEAWLEEQEISYVELIGFLERLKNQTLLEDLSS